MPRTAAALLALTLAALPRTAATQAPAPPRRATTAQADAAARVKVDGLLRSAYEAPVTARVEVEREHSAEPVGQRSGALYDQLARMDSLLFTALFAECDAERANALLTEDVEFYDDRTGLSAGEDLRADFRRLAGNCPAGNGVRRVLLPKTVEVYPIPGYGAVQTGVHHFVEEGASSSTVARFTHLWKRVDGKWRMARIVSLHALLDARRAAAARR